MEKSQGSMNPMLIVGALVLVLILGGVYLVSKKSTTSTNTTATSDSTAMDTAPEGSELNDTAGSEMQPIDSQVTDTVIDADAQVVNIEGGSFYFKPNEIRVKAGTPVKIVMTAADMMHDFNIDALNVKMPITKAGETGTVEFTPMTKGTFEFYCSVGNHKAQGQVGKLIVE